LRNTVIAASGHMVAHKAQPVHRWSGSNSLAGL